MTGPARRNGRRSAAAEIAARRAERPRIERDARGRFLPGHAGLRWGAPNVGAIDFRDALQADWEMHGPDCIERLRLRNPERYLLIMLAIVPRRWGGKGR